MQTLWYHYAAQTPNLDVSLLFMNLAWKPVMQKQKLPHTRYFADVRYLRDLSAGNREIGYLCRLLSIIRPERTKNAQSVSALW